MKCIIKHLEDHVNYGIFRKYEKYKQTHAQSNARKKHALFKHSCFLKQVSGNKAFKKF